MWRTDNAGNVPKVGDYVAYNHSGNIATGYITKIGRRNYPNIPIYTIHQVLPEEGHVSTVRGGAQCLLVLDSDGSENQSTEQS